MNTNNGQCTQLMTMNTQMTTVNGQCTGLMDNEHTNDHS